MGLCLHNKYGGWFALRCVFIFKNLEITNLPKLAALDPLQGDSTRILDTLQKFNNNWKDSTYRDTVPVAEKYSLIQREYFITEPRFRKDLIRKWMAFKSREQLSVYYIIRDIYETNMKKYLIDNFFLV